MIDLSYEAPEYGEMAIGSKEPEPETERIYPTLSVPENKGLAKAVKVGQEITATVKMRVSEIMIRESERKSMYPGECVRVEFEVMSMDPQGIKLDMIDEESGEDAMKKYFNRKKYPEGDED